MKDNDMTDRRRLDDRWHFRKEIHASHIIATVLFVLSGISAYFELDKRVAKEQTVNEYQERMFKEHIDTFNSTMGNIQQDVREIRKVIVTKYKDEK